MMYPEWGLLTPEKVSDWISFRRGENWTYGTCDLESMAAKQAQGVAYLWNLLSAEGVALLADEVGMGKTIQALGVAAMLWKRKPNAKVLVMAPNKDICKGWMREFNTFVDMHYRQADHLVKNGVDGGPVPAVQFCQRLDDVASAIEYGVGHLYLTTINALSGLVPSDKKQLGDKQRQAAEAASEIKKRIKEVLPSGFDLVIVDEAHYLRNKGGGSQKVAAAQAFFGIEGSRLSTKNLLLTATPSHTCVGDVRNILSYFLNLSFSEGEESNDNELVRQLLSKYSLRRLRLLEGRDGFNSKHQYRHEKDMPSDFSDNPDAEMFFALYQKRLVADLRKTKENKSLMYGYLEGFESVGRQDDADISTEDGDETEKSSQDWIKARDSELLHDLTKQYSEHFDTFPAHPKYGSLVEQCIPKEGIYSEGELEDRKHLIFVRRIPSVRELTQRINASYDDFLADMIISAWGYKQNDEQVRRWRDEDWSLAGFKVFSSEINEADIDTADSDILIEGDENDYLASRIAELFVVKKEKGGQADTAKVRLRFTKPDYVFSLFIEPSSDYRDGGYHSYYQDVGAGKPDYGNAALYTRQQSWPTDIERKAKREPDTKLDEELKTVWSLVYPYLSEIQKDKLAGWAKKHPTVAENFANYLKAGFLHASPVIVELYCWFVEFRRETESMRDAQKAYQQFYERAKTLIEKSLLLRYFKAALDSFDSLCGKIFDHGIDAWEDEWRSLKGLTSPAWYASGDIATDSRQRLIMGFNSPFYPNVLIATSVFKEGVNLHMACHQVHHYGLAGSPGDNEQRVGRIDRLFGCVNNRLKNQASAELSIYFPFLKGSVDEDQVASFIQRKYEIEEQMDACLPPDFDKGIDIGTGKNWKNYLRTPKLKDNSLKLEPYPPNFDGIAEQVSYQPTNTYTPEEIISHVESHLTSILDPKEDTFSRIQDSQGAAKRIFVIDPVVRGKEEIRRQPIVVEKFFYPGISALVEGTAYVLSFVSPISTKGSFERVMSGDFESALVKVEEFVKKNTNQYPLVRVCINEKATNSYFYLSLRVDLPVFSRHGKMEMLSKHELQMAFEQLKQMADDLEYLLFSGKQDLSLSELGDLHIAGCEKVRHKKVLTHRGRIDYKWEVGDSANGVTCWLVAGLDKEQVDSHYNFADIDSLACNEFHQLCQLNQRYPFVNFTREDGQSYLKVSFPAGDLQEDEQELLEAWFGYVVSVLN